MSDGQSSILTNHRRCSHMWLNFPKPSVRAPDYGLLGIIEEIWHMSVCGYAPFLTRIGTRFTGI